MAKRKRPVQAIDWQPPFAAVPGAAYTPHLWMYQLCSQSMPSVTYSTPDEIQNRTWILGDSTSVLTECKTCRTVLGLAIPGVQITIFNLNSLLPCLVGDRPADFDWGEGITNKRLA